MSAAISYLKEIPVDKISDRVTPLMELQQIVVILVCWSIVDFEFDIVISGINHGANIGNDVLYSGTVGAAVGGRNSDPPIAISVASYDAKDIDFISLKTIEIIERIIQKSDEYKGKVININFPDINSDEFKGVKATVISKRDVPPKPILVDEDGENQSIYRYNYSGEPLEEDFLTDAIAVQEGYVSVSVLDYSLNSKIFIDQLNRILNE